MFSSLLFVVLMGDFNDNLVKPMEEFFILRIYFLLYITRKRWKKIMFVEKGTRKQGVKEASKKASKLEQNHQER